MLMPGISHLQDHDEAMSYAGNGPYLIAVEAHGVTDAALPGLTSSKTVRNL
jgi:hypothetical protein